MLLLIAFAPTYIIVINLTSVQDVLGCPGLGLGVGVWLGLDISQ